ncbi:winged helix-turn-helix domain-containing protein [Frigoriflavimonas asaccharolytica]|uniref:Molybdate transport system regulatory protein n=1 Tax=Frigoriflavimonas asaccharolytica TaxID=2735899 RepID=A0A8J8K412_9FLAO|nr:LysR family transcriptional regulator [Frigoriflavimonas asaccharolytica]NRS91215.1 molybdate transport system regulatory protein [Frigoriflavimonas asaccharolytica]
MKIKSKIWIETENGILLSEGRVQLLKKIDEMGSLNKASKALNISYQKAWRLIDEVSKTTKKPLIETKIGGAKGGGTILTPYGKSLITIFETINKDCWKFLDEQLKKHDLC